MFLYHGTSDENLHFAKSDQTYKEYIFPFYEQNKNNEESKLTKVYEEGVGHTIGKQGFEAMSEWYENLHSDD